MQLPIQITFRNMDSSPAVEARVREEAEKLSEFYDSIMGCRVMVEIPHQHRQQGKRFHIRIDLTVPGCEIVVKHEPSLRGSIQRIETQKRKKEQEVAAPHKDIYVAIHNAFKAARRRLQDYARKQSGAVKQHELSPRARVSRLFPEESYGYLEAADGSEIYFHKNSVLNDGFEKLAVGTEVSFIEEAGDKGPQASTVRISGRKRGAGRA
jgi:cold shock CspA family protein/ribosome-associated translation inhibitor RaiA